MASSLISQKKPGKTSRKTSQETWVIGTLWPLLVLSCFVGACAGGSRPLPAPPIVQTRVVQQPISLPRRPDAIRSTKFFHYLVVTSARIPELQKEIADGNREPLDHLCLPYEDYLTQASWVQDVLRYVREAEIWMNGVEKQAAESRALADQSAKKAAQSGSDTKKTKKD